MEPRIASLSGLPTTERQLATRKRWRKAWLDVHLWLGLVLGLWLALIGLTGAILVFYYELEEVFEPRLFTVNVQPGGESAFKPLSDVMQAARSALPANAKQGFAFYPRTDEGAYWIFFQVPEVAEAKTERGDSWDVFVDPYTAKVLGKRMTQARDDWVPHEFFALMFSLHDELLLSWKVGGTIVGIVAALTIISIVIGMYLWWPTPGRWRSALTFKRGASVVRFVYDLHNLSGFYLMPVLLAVLLSGVYFNLRDEFLWVIKQFSPGTVDRYAVKSEPSAPGAQSIGLERALAVFRERFPEGRPDWLYNAVDKDSAYMVCAGDVKSVSDFADRRCAVIDQYSGKILQVTASGAETGGNTFIAWQWPLHSGQAFGLTGRILVLISGLVLPVLFVTGVMRWIHKRHARRRTAIKRANFMIEISR